MKKLFLIALMLLVSAVLFAESIPVMIGLDAGYNPSWSVLSMSNSGSKDDMYIAKSFVDFGAFVDFKYLRVGVGYEMSVGQPSTTYYTNGSQETNFNDTNNFAQQNIKIQVLGKYPIQVSDGFEIWPALGFDYTIALYYGHNNTNEITNSYGSWNGFTLKAGVGADIKLASNLYLSPVILFGWNNQASMFTTMFGLNMYDIKLDASLGLAYRF